MQASKKLTCHYRNLLRPLFIIWSNIYFHQWIIQKYRLQPIRVLGFPALLLLRSFRPVTIPDQKNLVIFPIQITLITPVLKSQIVLREAIHRDTLTHTQTSFFSTNLISTIATTRSSALTGGSRQNLIVAKLSPIYRNNESPLSVHDDLFVPSSINSKQTLAVAKTITVVQTQFGRCPSKLENVEKRYNKSTPRTVSQPASQNEEVISTQEAQRSRQFSDLMFSLITFSKLKAVSRLVRQNEQSVFIHKSQRPTELSYLMPPPMTSAKTKAISQPVRQNEESVSFEQPMTGVQSPPPTSLAPSIDIDRLTNQVYQTLERKIRLEKQRGGYR